MVTWSTSVFSMGIILKASILMSDQEQSPSNGNPSYLHWWLILCARFNRKIYTDCNLNWMLNSDELTYN